jgi:PAS domain S-box-containing protein
MMKERTQRGDKYHHWEWKMTCKDGTAKTVLWSNISDQFPIPGWAAWDIGMDITQLKQAGEMLELLGIKFDSRKLKETAEGIPGPWDTSQDRFLFTFFQAITKRERAENALQESENKYRTLLENLPQKIFLKDRNSVYVSCNEHYAGDLKIESEEIAGKTDYDFHPKELAEKYRADDKRIMESGEAEDIEEKYIQQEQEIIVHTVKTPVKDAQGNVIGILGIFWDISERKKAEEALKESELRFRTIFDNAADGMLLADVENKKFDAGNKVFCQMLGYNAEEIKNLGVMDIHPKETLPHIIEQFEKQARGELALTRDIPVKRKNGSIFYADINSFAITLAGKKYLMGIFRDVTERKRAEEAYRALVDHSLQGLVIFQDGRVVFTNKAMADISGYTVEEMLAMSSQQVQAFVHPEDRTLVWGRHRDRLAGKQLPERYEFRGIRKDGTMCWLEIHASRIEYWGKPAVQAAYVDITERKRAEEALRESRRRFRSLVEATSDWVWEVDQNGKYTYSSPKVKELLGYEPEEVIGKTPFDLMPPDEVNRVGTIFRNIVASQKPFERLENVNLHKDGRLVALETSGVPIFDTNGDFVGYRGIDRDITERRKAKEKNQ